jgi:hypothetical protein
MIMGCGLVIYQDLHLIFNQGHARTLIGNTVDGNQTFVTDAHTAEYASGSIPLDCFAKYPEAGGKKGCVDRFSFMGIA